MSISRFTTPLLPALLKPFLLGAGLALLAACGSSDKFPDSGNGQDPDPLVADVPLLYIERSLREDGNGNITPDDLKDPLTYHGNARLIMKARADQSAPTTHISARAVPGNVDVRDLAISPDGTLAVFALRAQPLPNVDENDQPRWTLWEYDIANDQVRPLPSSGGHDIMPRYLPDGRIIFASTRQKKSRAIEQDEGKDQFSHLDESRRLPALNLHVLDPETTDIEQVTFNQSHDLYPVVMPNGKIVFTRWENAGSNDALSLYEMNPDGTELQLLYGHHSQGTGATATRFVRSNVMPDGELFALIRPDRTAFYGGNFVRIDTQRYIDNTQPVAYGGGSGPAQTALTDRPIVTDGRLSRGGYFSAFYPLWDGTQRAVVSWSRCRIALGDTIQPCNDSNVTAPGASAAPAAYGIWIYDYANDTQIPVIAARAGVVYTDVALAAERPEPLLRIDGESLTAVAEGKVSANTFDFMIEPENEEAVIHIRSVYDFDGAPNDLGGIPARFLRVIKAVSEPPRDVVETPNGAIGVAGNQRMKEILGYAPIEPDGSVKVRVPANVALMLDLVDDSGKMLRQNGASGALLRHQNWISLRPGEVMECKGCHTAGSTAPHGRYEAQVDSINAGQHAGAAWPGTGGDITSPFAYATMAEARVDAAANPPSGEPATDRDIMSLSTDLVFNDVWSPTPASPVEIRYADLPEGLNAPANSNCDWHDPIPENRRGWNSRCRTVIHYEEHILPIWELDRAALIPPILADNPDHDDDNNAMTPAPAATCINCHNPTWMAANLNPGGEPRTQLNLADTPADAVGIQASSYRELFFADVPKELIDGALVDCTEEVPRLDNDNNPVLDENDLPIYDTVTCAASVPAVLSAGGAHASNAFFSLFESGGSHENYLTPAELKLIAEWLDIGAQYYNSHFAAAADPDNP